MQTAGENKPFGVTLLPGQNVPALNLAHKLRVDKVARELRGEGVEVNIVHPPENTTDWIDATIRAVQITDASHLVAVDNVMIPMENLRSSIRTIERKSAVEHILVNPLAAVE